MKRAGRGEKLFNQIFIALNAAVFLSGAQPSNPFIAMFHSSHFLWLLFYTLVLVSFGGQIEAQLGGAKFAFLYLAAGVVGNIGLLGIGAEEGMMMGAAAPLFGIMGAIVAINPGAFVVVEIFPMPAYAAAAFILLVHFVLRGGVDAFPFLAGMAIGYSMKGGLENTEQRPGWQRR